MFMEITVISFSGGGECIPYSMFQKFDENQSFDSDIDIKDDEKERDEKRFFLCKICRNAITEYETKINVEGHHVHIFTNPADIEYSIGCFSSANGCYTTGVPTSRFTWFPGFRWSYALCSKCRNHMGWSYKSSLSSFFGLILDNLIVN